METILNSLLDMVETNLQKMKSLGELEGRSDYSISKELKTIKLHSHRQSGHTTAIKNICKNRYFDSNLIVFPVINRHEEIHGVEFGLVVKVEVMDENNIYNFSHYKVSSKRSHHPIQYKIIAIDCDSILQCKLKKHYHTFVESLYKQHPESIFVFLQ